MRSNMGIIRVEKSGDFSIIANECLRNDALSARAKGVFAYLMTLPDDWVIRPRELVKHFTEGRDAIRTAIKELDNAGYIGRKPIRNADGTVDGWDLTVYETVLLKNRATVKPSDGESATTKDLSTPSTDNTNPAPLTLRSEPKPESQRTKTDQGHLDKGLGASAYTTDFIAFWDAYTPRNPNDSKRNAFKAWKQMLKEGATPDLIMAAHAKCKPNARPKNEHQYIPHAASWLRKALWETMDEPKSQPSPVGTMDEFRKSLGIG